MTLKGNVGEWSEVYTILKILGAGQIPAAKADLSEDTSSSFPVSRILRRQNNYEFDLVIGNKRVMKDTPVFGAGSPYTFANAAVTTAANAEDKVNVFLPRHQTFMEGAGILIPPQVQWYIDYRIFDVVTGATITPTDATAIGCYLFGTRVLLNFNTSI